MDPHIRRWHTRYRVIGKSADGAGLLERRVREHIAEPYAKALERAFTDDPAVYVVRRIHMELTVASPSLASETETARRWAGHICAAVIHTVTRESDRTDRVMRFEDTADYVACFVSDLLDSVAWERWYYGAFSAYRGLAIEEALRRVWMDFCDDLPRILQRLARMGRLRATLARLEPRAAAELWRGVLEQKQQTSSPEDFRVFFRTALDLVLALGLWNGAPVAEEELLIRYFYQSPTPPDWKQRRSLAGAVYSVIGFFHEEGLLRLEPDAFTVFVRQREQLLASMEWLDREWLAEALQSFLSRQAITIEIPAAAGRAAFSPLQRRVMDLLLRLLETGGIKLSPVEPESPANAIALFSILCAAEPELAASRAVPSFLQWLLARWAASGASLAQAVTDLLQHDAVAGTLAVAPLGVSRGAAPAQAAKAAITEEQEQIESTCAGIFLLSRAVLEGRATQLASALGLSPSAVLLALASEWAGCAPDALDPGALLWTGYDPQADTPLAQVRGIGSAACEELCAAIERILRDRSAFAPALAPVREPGAALFGVIAAHLLRLWAHWLPGLAKSSPDWLLNQLIRRRGLVRCDVRAIRVALCPAPLDVVLHMAGYLKPVPAAPWLGDRRLEFTLDAALISQSRP